MTDARLKTLNPYLTGLYAPVREEVSARDLPVIGEIPRDLRGAYFRNVPNPMTPPSAMHHWFNGDGMLHGVWFENGRARYANRYVRTADFEAEIEGADAMPGIFTPSRAVEGVKIPGNTDVVVHNGRQIGRAHV